MYRRVYGVLALWCVSVILPGVLAVLVVPGPFNAAAVESSGSRKVYWIAGYLIQLAILAVALLLMGKLGQAIPWFVASLLPWLVDWTLVSSLWLVAAWIPVVVAFAAWLGWSWGRTQSLLLSGAPAQGTVLEIVRGHFTTTVNNTSIKRRLRLKVEPRHGQSYEATITGLFGFGNTPDPGDRIALRVDPANPQRIAIDQAAVAAERLERSGVHAIGSVQSVTTCSQHPSAEGLVECRLRLTVTHNASHLTYDADLTAELPSSSVPQPGDNVPLRVDPANFKRVVLASRMGFSQG